MLACKVLACNLQCKGQDLQHRHIQFTPRGRPGGMHSVVSNVWFSDGVLQSRGQGAAWHPRAWLVFLLHDFLHLSLHLRWHCQAQALQEGYIIFQIFRIYNVSMLLECIIFQIYNISMSWMYNIFSFQFPKRPTLPAPNTSVNGMTDELVSLLQRTFMRSQCSCAADLPRLLSGHVPHDCVSVRGVGRL